MPGKYLDLDLHLHLYLHLDFNLVVNPDFHFKFPVIPWEKESRERD